MNDANAKSAPTIGSLCLVSSEEQTMNDLPHNHHFLAHIIAAAIREQERWEAERGYLKDGAILVAMKELREKVAAGDRVVFNSREESEREQTDAERVVPPPATELSQKWFAVDGRLPGLTGRLMLCVHGSVREGYYHGEGRFTDSYGEQRPSHWACLPWAPITEGI